MKYNVLLIHSLLLCHRLNSFLQISNSSGGSVINQVSGYCIKLGFLDFECADLFANTIVNYFKKKKTMLVTLHEIPIFQFSSSCASLSFRLHYDEGSIFSQIDKFCISVSCSQFLHAKLKSFFTKTTAYYWFPNVDLILRTHHKEAYSENHQENKFIYQNYKWSPIISIFSEFSKDMKSSFSRQNEIFDRIARDFIIDPKENSHRVHRVFYTIFAGRKEYMETQFKYTDMLLRMQLVSEVHVWDFVVHDNDPNAQYLSDYIRDSPLMGYRLFRRPMGDDNRGGGLDSGYLFRSYYAHYSQNQRYDPEDIVIKADDDILFVDVTAFQSFINNIQDDVFYIPNIINNDVTFAIHAKRKVHPHIIEAYQSYVYSGVDYYQHISDFFININIDIDNSDVQSPRVVEALKRDLPKMRTCPLSSVYCYKHNFTWFGGLFTQGIIASRLHDIFLEDPLRYITQCKAEGQRYVEVGQRFSVNMFAGKVELFRKAFQTFLTPDYCCDDEVFMTKWPSISQKKNILDTHFTVSHFTFGNQRFSYGHNMSYDIMRYLELAKAMEFRIEQLLGIHIDWDPYVQHFNTTNDDVFC